MMANIKSQQKRMVSQGVEVAVTRPLLIVVDRRGERKK